MLKIIICFSLLFLPSAASFAYVDYAEPAANLYLKSISDNPKQIEQFFKTMPKGGDLHIHLAGASRAETLLKIGSRDSICIYHQKAVKKQTSLDCEPIKQLLQNKLELNKLIDSWSMRNFDINQSTGHDHFFSTFELFSLIADSHNDLILADVVRDAFRQHEQYLEIMITPDHGSVSKWGRKIHLNENFSRQRNLLLKSGLEADIKADDNIIRSEKNKLRKYLSCEKPQNTKLCGIKINYLYQIFREQPQSELFAQMLVGFVLASINPNVVGINLVQPEDGVISLRDYKQQMKMLRYFHSVYPMVNIALHAGELPLNFTFTNILKNHVLSAILIGHAQRIGHGANILGETNSKMLFKIMRTKAIPVEINLTSNTYVLGLKPKKNPLPLYLKQHVPIILSTDDAGILRTDLSHEYTIAFQNFGLTYSQIKDINRNSLTYSFLPGISLWAVPYISFAEPCRNEKVRPDSISGKCLQFLHANLKASFQWVLENELQNFEKQINSTKHWSK
jgi:adenosine deaminase